MSDLLSCAQSGGLLVTRTDRDSLAVSGPDRCSWLNGMLTCDLAHFGPGQAAVGLALTRKGRVLTDVLVACLPEQVLIGVDASSASTIRDTLDHFLIMEDAEIGPPAAPLEWISVFGPFAEAMSSQARQQQGIMAAPMQLFGHPAAVIVAPRELLAVATRAIQDRHGDSALLVPYEQFDSLRLDMGIPRFATEFGDSTYPQEAGLDDYLIAFNKGCYLGQEVVVKMRSRGRPSRKLVRLLLEQGAPVPQPPAPVLSAQGQPVGAVTSVATSWLMEGRGVAFAMIRMQQAEDAEPVRVGGSAASVLPAYGWLAQSGVGREGG